ncbi:DUF6053 domain-containing protein [Lysobacter enzymogenes]|uniref:DUF6053 domain-containing protein n=1 Tax=Lysobacter enzymogenes TaxID=69 RepID=UPI003D189AFE
MRSLYAGGPSGPMLVCQSAAIRHKSIGPEGPPTKAQAVRQGGQPVPLSDRAGAARTGSR